MPMGVSPPGRWTLASAVLVCAVVRGQTAGEILEKNLAAAGGRSRVAAIRAERLTGELSLRGQHRGPLTIELKRPNRIRVEAGLPGGTFAAGYDGSAAWQVNPALSPGRPIPLPPVLVRRLQELLTIDGPLAVWLGSGLDVRLAGSEDLDGDACFRVEALSPDGASRSLLIDARTGRLREWRGRLSAGPRSSVYEVRFSDWSDAGGVAYPSCVTAGRAGESPRVVLELRRLEVDPDIGDEWFNGP